MIKNYISFIENVFKNITTGSAGDVTFLDYIKAIGFGIGTMLMILVIIGLIAAMFWIPIKGRKAVIKDQLDELKKLGAEYTDKSINYKAFMARSSKINKVILKKTAIFIGCLIVFYLPFVIPTVLFVIDKILGLF